MLKRLVLLFSLVVGACGGDDAPADDAGADSGRVDAGASDAGTSDAGAVDAGGTDGGATDAGGEDGGGADAGSDDAGMADAGQPDAGRTIVEERCARRMGSCSVDADCMPSGCGGEMCAPESLITTCDCVAPSAAACGCVDGMCAWYATGS